MKGIIKLLLFLLLIFLFTYFIILDRNVVDYGSGFKQDPNQHAFYSDDYEYPIKNKKAYELNKKGLKKVNRRKFNAPLNLFEKANEWESNNPLILSNIGNIYKRQEIYGRAKEYYNRSIEVSDSNYLPAIVNLSSLFMDMKNYEKSIKLSESLLGRFEEPKYQAGLFFNLIVANSNMGACERARDYYSELELLVKPTGPIFIVERAIKHTIF